MSTPPPEGRLKVKNPTPQAWVGSSLFPPAGAPVPADRGTSPVSDRPSPQAVKTEDSHWEVKVTKNGAVLASYMQAGARGVGAIFDGKLIQMYLAIPDNKHVLTIDFQWSQAGGYPLPTQHQTSYPGESRLYF